MNAFLIALGLALLPALGNFAGGLLAEMIAVSRRTLSLALHGAAGIVLAVVAVELLPAALQAEPRWLPVAAFVAGSAFFVLIDRILDVVPARWVGAGPRIRPL